MQQTVSVRKPEKAQKGNMAGVTLRHLTAMLVGILAMACGTYLFNLTPEKLCAIGVMRENLVHIKFFAFCVIFLGMDMFLCDLLDWHEKRSAWKEEQDKVCDGV